MATTTTATKEWNFSAHALILSVKNGFTALALSPCTTQLISGFEGFARLVLDKESLATMVKWNFGIRRLTPRRFINLSGGIHDR